MKEYEILLFWISFLAALSLIIPRFEFRFLAFSLSPPFLLFPLLLLVSTFFSVAEVALNGRFFSISPQPVSKRVFGSYFATLNNVL